MAKQKVPAVAPGRGGARPGKQGQPAFEPTEHQRELICQLVSAGWSNEDMSLGTGIPIRTLARHFAHELKTGRKQIHAQVTAKLVRAALDPDPEKLTGAIFYAKYQMRWRQLRAIGFEDDEGKIVNPANLFQVNIT